MGFTACSPKVSKTVIEYKTPLAAEATQLVLKAEDSLPAQAVKVGHVHIGDSGLTMKGCDYPSVLERARLEARSIGGNVIKITEHKLPTTFGSSCHRIRADIYHLSDIRPYEKEIYWSANRRLEWEDFKGAAADHLMAGAVTYSSIVLEAKPRLVKTKWYVEAEARAVFDCQLSWVQTDQKLPEVLQHEQGHFDIAEIFARRMEKAFREKNFTADEYNAKGEALYRDYFKQFELHQSEYDKDTSYGTGPEKQQAWLEKIRKELEGDLAVGGFQ